MSNLTHELYLKVGDTVYTGVATDVNVPGLEPVVWEGSTDTNVVADVPVGQRKLNLSARQDWKNETGLCRFLADNEGEQVTVIFSHVPGAVDGVYFQTTITAASPTIGAKLNAYGEFSMAFPCTRPVIVAAPA